MKRLVFCLLVLVILSQSVIFAEEVEVDVLLNDNLLYSDTPHIIRDGSTFIVSRFLVEALGGQIFWNETYRRVSIFSNEDIIEFYIDNPIAYVNGTPLTLSKAPFIKSGRTMIPLRFVSENLGCDVSWDANNYTVSIIKEGLVVDEKYIAERTYSEEDLYWLSRIVTVESGSQSMEMALGIANVVLNRVKSDQFPDTVYDVIFQVDVYKQFPPAHKASFKNLEPSALATEASIRALKGENNVNACLFFNNQPFKSKKDDLYDIIDGEYFYY